MSAEAGRWRALFAGNDGTKAVDRMAIRTAGDEMAAALDYAEKAVATLQQERVEKLEAAAVELRRKARMYASEDYRTPGPAAGWGWVDIAQALDEAAAMLERP